MRGEDLRLFQVERSERTGAKLGDDGWQQESGLAGCSPGNFVPVASWWSIEGGIPKSQLSCTPCRPLRFVPADPFYFGGSLSRLLSLPPSLPPHPPISAGCLDVRWMCPGTKSRRGYTWLSHLLQICPMSLVWCKTSVAVGILDYSSMSGPIE